MNFKTRKSDRKSGRNHDLENKNNQSLLNLMKERQTLDIHLSKL